jgi:hypothetical protein
VFANLHQNAWIHIADDRITHRHCHDILGYHLTVSDADFVGNLVEK